jgi:hypothetical protein
MGNTSAPERFATAFGSWRPDAPSAGAMTLDMTLAVIACEQLLASRESEQCTFDQMSKVGR